MVNFDVDAAMKFVQKYVKIKSAGDKLTLKILRDGEQLTKTLVLADYGESMKGLYSDNGDLHSFPLELEALSGVQTLWSPIDKNEATANKALKAQIVKQKQLIEDQDLLSEIKETENELLKNQVLLLEVQEMLNQKINKVSLMEINKKIKHQNAKVQQRSIQLRNGLKLDEK